MLHVRPKLLFFFAVTIVLAALPASPARSQSADTDTERGVERVEAFELPPLTPDQLALLSSQTCGVLKPDSVRLAALGVDEHVASGSARVALVVGMDTYRNGIPNLRNPLRDTATVAQALLGLGFTVYYAANAEGAAVLECAEALRADFAAPDIAVLYYAGHGIQIENENYLLAIDADPQDALGPGFVPVNDVADVLRANAAATLIFLDACRNNPFSPDGPAGLSPSTGRGLTRTDAGGATGEEMWRIQARGVSVSYSTSPNAVAQDGDGELSPFATAFAQHIATPGYSIQRVMADVANAVGEATDWTQAPWTLSSLTSELELAGPMTMEEATFWQLDSTPAHVTSRSGRVG
jgi:hypothetical protein